MLVAMNDLHRSRRFATGLLFVPAILMVTTGGIGVLGAADRAWIPVTVAIVLAMTFLAERVAPYATTWNNRGPPSFGADAISAAVSEALTVVGVMAAPLAAGWFSLSVWPTDAPQMVRLLVAVAVLDAGVTIAHWWSHRRMALWRFHAVHHSADRLYGLNGLMKHPVHLVFETTVGMAPLVVIGIDTATAAALAGLVAVQLVLQHANVDYRVGRLGNWLAWNTGHRLHHIADDVDGNVNFGLFTLVWDRLLGTYRRPDPSGSVPTVGLAGHVAPSRYLQQLAMPWGDGRSGSTDAISP